MSIVYDPNLIDQLLKVGAELENKISKKGQVTPPDQQLADSLKALLFNLRDQITPLKEAPGQVGHAVEGAIDLSSANMDSMGDLVQWLVKHGTKVGGATIVQPGNIERPGEDYGYFKIEPGTEIIVPLARPDRSVVAYWINPSALKQYLVSLQADPKLKNNVMFQVQLLKLIQDANKQLDIDVSEQYKEPEKVLPDTTVVDYLPQILDPKQWELNGSIPLTLGDLKSVDAFGDWIRNKKVALKTESKALETSTVTIDDLRNFDLCAVINVLNSRAQAKGRGSQRPEARSYISQITQLASQANCPLTTPGQITPGGPATQVGTSRLTPAILKELASLRPFNSQYISFPDITTFLDTYSSVYPDIQSQANDIKGYIRNFQSRLAVGTDTIQMYNLTTTQFKSWLKNPADALPAAELLYDIVHYAGTLYQRLVNSLQTIGRDPRQLDPNDYRGMMQQVVPGGPQLTNISTLTQLRYLLGQEGLGKR